MPDVLQAFHPAVAAWFRATFPAPTAAQVAGWPAIVAGRHTLIAAPTGSGKTLAALLAAIDALVRRATAGALRDEVDVVYVSPLKALSNDIETNLEAPLAGIGDALSALGLPPAPIRVMVRTGDTPARERAAMRREPPHLVVTTPESLYILLTSDGGRRLLATTRTVIVDEIHALAPNKRGSHLALSLERLDALVREELGAPPRRIGLSATQKPLAEVARYLVGTAEVARDGAPACAIVDGGHLRKIDLAIELPRSPLEAVMSGEAWEEIYDRLAELIREHRTTLCFVHTRRLAERVTRKLAERLGDEAVTAHHGSLSREHRHAAEKRLKHGELRALVATASLELGIDVGDVDLVCQIGSTRSVSALLQRTGRSGHRPGAAGVPKGRIFPLSRDELVEAAALLRAVREGELDVLSIPPAPLDVLAQQIVAEVAARPWEEEGLFALARRAWPYRELARADFDAVVRMVADGFSTQRGRRGALVHRDAVHGLLRPRRGARLAAITSGGAIPDTADYDVLLEPGATRVGSLNEDFAIESMPGDIFQLGNASYRIRRIEPGKVRVEDALGQPPTIPFWLGEAPSRTAVLSAAVSRLRARIVSEREAAASEQERRARVEAWLAEAHATGAAAATQLADYLGGAHATLGLLPTQERLLLERFFDEAGGMHLVLHSPYGSRINRAWGLALRKCFCRRFNFELQAAADEDAVVISLGPTHSFELREVWSYLRSATVRPLLVQALLDAPMFMTRWRWNATRSLAVLRFRGGRRVAPQLQRMEADDLLTVCFPDKVACVENVVGEREIPDHPLVRQTVDDCLFEAMDVAGLEDVLARIERGEIATEAADRSEPSPLAAEILGARPYAFLDDAPLEERRTQAVLSRRWLDPETASSLGALDAEAIAEVRREAWPDPRDAEEVHDALALHACFTSEEAQGWRTWLDALATGGRATALAPGPGSMLWVAAERLPQLRAVHAGARVAPELALPAAIAAEHWERDDALVAIVRGRLEALGPTTVAALGGGLAVAPGDVGAALVRLEAEGFVLRGRFSPAAAEEEWCERRLLARIHRRTLGRLRREIEPVSVRDLLRFLSEWQHVDPEARLRGPDGLAAALEQLDGFEAPASAWESDLLAGRVSDYEPSWLDALCLSGRAVWARRSRPAGAATVVGGVVLGGPVRSTPVALASRASLGAWLAIGGATEPRPTSPAAARVLEVLAASGASFFDALRAATGLVAAELEGALGELVSARRVSSDGFGGLRGLIAPARRNGTRARRRREGALGMAAAGRWSLLPCDAGDTGASEVERVEIVARALLRRWGVVFRKLLEREAELPPWRDLLRVYRRLEARGEVRGGRFVAGPSGEQYALSEAVGLLRAVKRKPETGGLVAVSGADPLNLVGILTPGPRLPAIAKNRLLYRDGLPVAMREGGEVILLDGASAADRWELESVLCKRKLPPAVRAYLGNAT
jgi:ATP-dependent Lhr-like helicase